MYFLLDRPYDILDVNMFLHSGKGAYTSPAEQVLQDFIARGINVDELYCMLAEMEAEGCMRILEKHGEANGV